MDKVRRLNRYNLLVKDYRVREPIFKNIDKNVIYLSQKRFNKSFKQLKDVVLVTPPNDIGLYHENSRYVLKTESSHTNGRSQVYYQCDSLDNIDYYFGSNINIVRNNCFCIPIGTNGDYKHIDRIFHVNKNNVDKDILCYANFVDQTNPEHRSCVRRQIRQVKNIKYESSLPVGQYLNSLSRSKFSISPKGAGIDCYRIWESILLGCIPIVPDSNWTKYFSDLPILVIDNYTSLNEMDLHSKYEEMVSKDYNLNKMCFNYWVEKIKEVISKGVS